MDLLVTFIPLAAIAALVAAWLLARGIMAAPTGNERMVAISDAVKQGAAAYMNRQYRTIAIVAVLIAAVFAVVALTAGSANDRTLWWWTTVGFLVGALFSGVSGFIGMNVAVRANVRVAQAARTGLGGALR
ncbi:MAG TPA: sodium/proton-translocating pyrophosphatase, partial [Trueperaceae bacterium]|nr:sodium/proton-translocating pyrophosphatase [Trueperaceae bacterium]